jgi:5-methylcytosine-specific restriction endonuclease McrA
MNGKEKSKYRSTKQWKDFRKKLIENNNYQCEICGVRKKKGLHIHHLDEDAYGRETKEDVVVVCSTCHKLIEWMVSRTKNRIDINDYCENLKDVYLKTIGGSNENSQNKKAN